VYTENQAIYDVIKNTFRDEGIKHLQHNIEDDNIEVEISTFVKLAGQLGK